LVPAIWHYPTRLDICCAVPACTVGDNVHRCSRPRRRREPPGPGGGL